jgi:hypothetical protein
MCAAVGVWGPPPGTFLNLGALRWISGQSDGTILAPNDIELLCGGLTACRIILRSEIKVNSAIEYSVRFFLL